jgi:hypothetical protein
MPSRFGNSCLTTQRYAAVVMSHERARIGPDRRLVLRNRLVVPANGPENIAEIVARAGTVRTQ